MAEMAVQGLLEFWPFKSVNNPNFGLPISEDFFKSNRFWDILYVFHVPHFALYSWASRYHRLTGPDVLFQN